MKEIANRPEWKLAISKRMKGKNNPFYGKKHSEEAIKKMIENRDYSYTQTDEFRAKQRIANLGKNNSMYGKSIYDVWVEKYGKEEADKKQKELNKKRSKNAKGKNNPMYGKPTPQGSGNGWSGWYKGWYFRSLKELSYMIKVIEKNNYKWESAECDKLSIKYIDYDGSERTYRADFLVEDKILVEIKPKKLMETRINKLKKEAALEFCDNHGLEYSMVDVRTLSMEDITKLYQNKEIKFIKKYDMKMKELLNESKRRKSIDG